MCARKDCQRPAKGKSAYCSGSCRAKASHERLYQRKKPASDWTGPSCWCGKPAKFKDGDRPKCGNHALGHRAEKERWRKLFKQLQAMGYEWAKRLIDAGPFQHLETWTPGASNGYPNIFTPSLDSPLSTLVHDDVVSQPDE